MSALGSNERYNNNNLAISALNYHETKLLDEKQLSNKKVKRIVHNKDLLASGAIDKNKLKMSRGSLERESQESEHEKPINFQELM